MSKEIWKPIKAYEGLYEVSYFGNVRRLSGSVPTKSGGYKIVSGRTLTLSENATGYLNVTLYKNGIPKQYMVHRLVAEAFAKGKTKERNIVNHIDNNRKNNHAFNLEWVTSSENTIHAIGLRTLKKKTKKVKTKTPRGEKEKWLPIPEYEELYVVSNWGRVKRLETKFIRKDGKLYVNKERFLTPFLYKNKNYVVKLTKNSESKTVLVHRLVADLFVPNPENKSFVQHKDGFIENNIVFNLKWVNSSELYHEKFESTSTTIDVEYDEREENWKDIIGYEGYFQVSNFGRVRSCERIIVDKLGREYLYKSRFMSIRLKGVYHHIALCKNGKRKDFPIHRLVATAFIPNDDSDYKIFVNHINSNKLDNHAGNLEWVTPKGNSEHMSNLDRGAVKPIQQFDLEGNFIKEYPSAIRAAKENDFLYGGLLSAVAKDNRYMYGYLWKWADDKTPLVPYKDAREKRVLRYSMEGDYLQKFESLQEATNYLTEHGYPNAKTANVSKACTGVRNYSYDSQWRHEGDDTPIKKLRQKVKSVVKLSLEGKHLQTYENIREAEIELGINLNTSGISKCCNGRQKSAHGFKWMFEEDYKKALG